MSIFWKIAIFTSLVFAASEEYFETLNLKQLKNGQVLADFEFKTILDSKRQESFNLLPKAIGEIIKEFDIRQLDLHFTVGRWRHDRYPTSKQVYPSGALLKTWIDGDFKRLTNSLAGLFCSSLNFMKPAVTSSPVLSFFPKEPRLMGNSTLYYSLLPREAVCTENLTPWLKLLPCHSKAGLASLLSPYRIYDGAYQSMGISWAPKCMNDGCTKIQYEFTQTITVIMDPVRLLKSRDWSMSTLFSGVIHKSCPLAKSTSINLSMPPNSGAYTLNPPGAPSQAGFSYDIPKTDSLNLEVKWETQDVDNTNPELSPVKIHRYLGGTGQEEGSLNVEFQNTLPNPVQIVYFENIPWILRIWLHTMKLKTSNGVEQKGLRLIDSLELPIETFSYTPAIDRQRPTLFEMVITLPSNSTTSLKLDYDCAFIKADEHYPDASYGFDIGVGMMRIGEKIIFTQTALVRLPTPDFSMPYNVITLTCTALSLYYGSVFNMLTRQYFPIIQKKK